MEVYRQGIGRLLASKCRWFRQNRSNSGVTIESLISRSTRTFAFARFEGANPGSVDRSHVRSRKHELRSSLSRRRCCCSRTLLFNRRERHGNRSRGKSLQGVSALHSRSTVATSCIDRNGTSKDTIGREKKSPQADETSSELEQLLLKGSRMTSIAQSAWRQLIKEGMTVVDATCGNGNDAKWLAERIGPEGHLFAFDIQEDAIRSTRAVLEDEVDPQRLPNVRFIHGCHSTLKEHVQAAHLVCFNLGFLPGGDREVISRPDTTVAAIKDAMSILEPQGVISILAYVGHPGGMEEYKAVQEVAKHVNPQEFSALEQRILNRPNAPVLIMLWRRP